MGACQTQQNIDINLIINNCETQTKKRKYSETKIINKKIKKAYINNIQFNNTKKTKIDIYKLKKPTLKNKIPLDKVRKEISITRKENTNSILRLATNKLNLSYTGEKLPLDNIRSNSKDSKKIMNMSYNTERGFEKKNILTDRNSNSITKDSEKNSKNNNNIQRKIINDEDDTEKIILNLNEQIKNKKEKNDGLILSFDDFDMNYNKDELQLYHLNEFNFNPENKYSNEKDFDDILQSQVYKNKINFTNLILSLPERKWYSELIELSDKFKSTRQQKNIDDIFLSDYLNKMIKIYNHFNHLVLALSYYYSYSLFLKRNYWFKNESINLPNFKSLEYIRGFEWKGLHIRVLPYDQAKKIIREVKSLKCAFFDFLSLFNNNYNNNNLLSNEIIFPLMSYAYIGGIILYVSVEIKKFYYDSNFLNTNINQKNVPNRLDNIYKSLIRKSLRFSDKNDINDCTIDNSDDNFSFDENILNEEINISNFSKVDLIDTKILKNIKEENLLKIFDEYNEENNTDRKYKFILKNAYDLIPDLFKENDQSIYNKLNILNCLDIKNEFKEPRFVNLTKVNNLDKKNEMNVLSKLIRIKATKENIEIYKNKIEGIDYKIIFDNNKKGNKINEQITKFFVQCPLLQNYELSRILITEYLNVGNLNGILNKYYKENTQEIPDRNIIIYRTKFKTKLKLALLNINNQEKKNIFPKSNDEYISYLKQFCKELSSVSSRILNIDNLFHFCDKYGFNKKFLPFCLEYISDEFVTNLIQIYLYVSFIKKFYDYREGQTLMMKLAIYERNKDDAIINSSEKIKNNNIIEIQKKFFLDVIKLILLPVEYLKEVNNIKESFSKNFFENISFFIFLRMIKLKNYEKYIDFKSSLVQLEVKQILQNLNETCRKNPFLFIDTLERILNFRLNSFIKYKSSIDINNIKQIKKDDIVIFTAKVNSFIDVSAISSYIFNIFLQNNKEIKNNNNILPKIDLGFFFPELNFENLVNYVDNKLILNKINYNVTNVDTIKSFCEIIEHIFNGVISYNGKKELILAKIYVYLLLNSFFCENNSIKAKEILNKIKEILSYQNIFSLRQRSIVYLFEGLISFNDLTSSEENYIKSLFLLLLTQGDIRNNLNKISPVLIIVIIQLIKIINSHKNKNRYLIDYLDEMLSILKDKFKNINETLKILESDINTKSEDIMINKNLMSNNYIKFFICNSIIEYFYSNDTLLFNNDILVLFKIKQNDLIIKKRNNYIIEHLFDEISYKKNAPSNIVIFFGQLNNNISKPKVMYSLLGKKIKKIFVGYESNFVVDIENKIYTWGNNLEGQLGIKPEFKNRYINQPIKITIKEFENNENIKNIICAEKFTFFISNKNRIYISGYFPFLQKKYLEPKRINFNFEKEKIVQISIGENFCLFLTGWGNVYNIGLGINSEEINENNINKVPNLNNIEKIFCGYKHCFAIAKNNIIFCWGKNELGQLGINESIENILIPRKLILNYENESEIDNIFCGKDFTIFHNNKKEILVCGNNEEGQLGLNKDIYYNLKPVINEQFYNLNIIKISCGEKFCVAMIKDLMTNIVNIWGWGRNKEGQLGIDEDVEISRPKLVPSLLEFVNHYPVDISCGKNHCLILLEKKDEINVDNNQILNQIITKYNKF